MLEHVTAFLLAKSSLLPYHHTSKDLEECVSTYVLVKKASNKVTFLRLSASPIRKEKRRTTKRLLIGVWLLPLASVLRCSRVLPSRFIDHNAACKPVESLRPRSLALRYYSRCVLTSMLVFEVYMIMSVCGFTGRGSGCPHVHRLRTTCKITDETVRSDHLVNFPFCRLPKLVSNLGR